MFNQNKNSVTTPIFNHIFQFTLPISYKAPSAVANMKFLSTEQKLLLTFFILIILSFSV